MVKKYLKNKGSALLMAIVVITIIGGIGVAFIYWFTSEGRHSTRRQLGVDAVAKGEAGVERARSAILHGDDGILQTWQPGYATNFFIIMDGERIEVEIEHLGSEE